MEAAEPIPAPNCDNPNPETAGVLPDKPLLPRPIDGVRTNLGTRNHEFLRLPDSYGYTVVIRKLRPKFKFPAKIEMGFSQILVIR